MNTVETFQRKLNEFEKDFKINCVESFSLSENELIKYEPRNP